MPSLQPELSPQAPMPVRTRRETIDVPNPCRYLTVRLDSWPEFERAWKAMVVPPHGLPFQSPLWLKTWFDTFAGSGTDFGADVGAKSDAARPVLLTVRDSRTATDVMLLPLVAARIKRLETITFADFSVTDCNAPALAPGVPQDAQGATDLWASIQAALPPADLIKLDKMPGRVGSLINPLTLVDRASACIYNQHIVGISQGWPAYLASLDRHHRKELGRSLRLFEAAGTGPRFRFAQDAADATGILAFINGSQLERLAERGVRHIFDDGSHRRFYDGVVAQGGGGDTVIMTALELDGRTVAGLMAITAHPRVTLLRLGHQGGPYARIGLGRLMIEQTLKALVERGFTEFDFSIGEGEHKRRFGTQAQPLWTLSQRLSWRAIPSAITEHARKRAKQVPALRAIAQRLKRLQTRNGGPRGDV